MNLRKIKQIISALITTIFLIYWFGFIGFWCYSSIKDGAYLQTIFSIPFWIAGFHIIKKKFFNQKNKTNNEKKEAKINYYFSVLIPPILVITAFLIGIVTLFFGIKETHQLKIKTKNYITTNGYYSNYDIYKSDEDGTTYKLTYIYIVDGKEYLIKTDYGTNYIPEENSVRKIKYNPNNPEEAIITGANGKKILIYFGTFSTLVSLAFIISKLSELGYFNKFKIDILGTYIGLIFFIIGIGMILIQTETTMSLIETIKSFGLLIIVPIMFMVFGIIEFVTCLRKKK